VQIYRLQVKRPAVLLSRLTRVFGDHALISFEGELSKTDLASLPGATNQPSRVLDRVTMLPQFQFIRCPVGEELNKILDKIDLRAKVVHLQIELAGRLVFASYDHFARDSVWVSADVGETVVQSLKDIGIISDYSLYENVPSSRYPVRSTEDYQKAWEDYRFRRNLHLLILMVGAVAIIGLAIFGEKLEQLVDFQRVFRFSIMVWLLVALLVELWRVSFKCPRCGRLFWDRRPGLLWSWSFWFGNQFHSHCLQCGFPAGATSDHTTLRAP